MKEQKEERVYLDDNAHDFHIHIANECGVGYNEFRTFLDNLDDEQILESIDSYVELKLNKMENTQEAQVEQRDYLAEQLEVQVKMEAISVYKQLLLHRFKSTPSNDYEGRIEDEIKEVEAIVNAFKKYFKVG